ncbi:DUF2934 domain-containing protein [Paracoccus sp. SY]|uniref:DUF2934 domain-containing protein n=1 Tax=Paracoccus sp. SY TaxID=1330255 RepID=UPI001EFD75DE|nr:DUF2934 domain-containing protein [Paracoccus sp. SY]
MFHDGLEKTDPVPEPLTAPFVSVPVSLKGISSSGATTDADFPSFQTASSFRLGAMPLTPPGCSRVQEHFAPAVVRLQMIPEVTMQDDEHIRHRAYQIWEAEGRPEGREAQHWAQARDELGVPGDDALLEGGEDQGLSELPAEVAPDDGGRADGRIIEAGEGGTAGGLDEAEEALASGDSDTGEGR